METENIKSAVEAILFAAGEPVPAARISLILEVDEKTVFAAAKELADEYSFGMRGMRILTLDNKLQMCSSPEYAAVISKTLEQRKPPMLSQPALETLAVVAYFQPVTRAYIDQVRGVDSSGVVNSLVERDLLEEYGRLDLPGRPIAYKTTENFLRCFGLTDIKGLPAIPDSTDQIDLEEFDEMNFSGSD